MTPAASGLQPRRQPDGGITLIEVLVVLAVIGVATGVTMLGLNATDRDIRAEAEAVRLARNLTLGVDEAILAGTPLALMWDAGGYSFMAWSAADAVWGPANPNTLARRHDLRDPVNLTLNGTVDNNPVMIASNGIGPVVEFEFGTSAVNGSSDWIVAFDGYSATARPKGMP